MRTNDAEQRYPAALRRRLLERAAQKAAQAGRVGLLAPALEEWRTTTGISRTELADALGTDETGLARLALCRPPRQERFGEDADEIAAATGCDAGRLIHLLRQMEVLSVLGDGAASEMAPVGATDHTFGLLPGRLLLAARDRSEDEWEMREEPVAADGAGEGTDEVSPEEASSERSDADRRDDA